MTDKINSFKSELKTLLEKYNVNIGFSVSSCSDTWGLNDERITAFFNDSQNEITLSDGWSVDRRDL